MTVLKIRTLINNSQRIRKGVIRRLRDIRAEIGIRLLENTHLRERVNPGVNSILDISKSKLL